MRCVAAETGSLRKVVAALAVGLFLRQAAAADAAFEAPPADPVALSLAGAGPAWPASPAGQIGDALFGAPPGGGARLSSLQWVAAPELQRQGASAWAALPGVHLAASAERLALAGYSETLARLTLVRAVNGTGWGGSVGVAWARWGSPDAMTRAWPVVVTAGVAPAAGLRMAVRASPGAGGLDERLEAGVSYDLAPEWCVGAAYEARPAGARLSAALQCRPTSRLALRGGFVPADGSVAFGVGFGAGPVALDLAQSRHPRLGAVSAAALTLAWGGRARPAVAAEPADVHPVDGDTRDGGATEVQR